MKTKKTNLLILRINPEIKNQFKSQCALRNIYMSKQIENMILQQIQEWTKRSTSEKK